MRGQALHHPPGPDQRLAKGFHIPTPTIRTTEVKERSGSPTTKSQREPRFPLTGPTTFFKLSHPLAHALAFERRTAFIRKADGSGGIRIPKEIQRSEGTVDVRAHHPVNVDRLIPVIYVYCDLIERQQVGDSYVQLLRTLPTRTGVRGDLITETFDNIHYGGVERGSFEMVEIQLVDHLGINIPFRRGIVTVKLHFKRKGTTS